MKILLVTPYTGGNLGDAAIQEAVMHHLRQRIPGVSFHLVTLSPRATTALHHVPSFPIAAGIVESPASATGLDSDLVTASHLAALPRQARDRLTRSGAVGASLLLPLRKLRRAVRIGRDVGREIVHTARAFRLVRDSDAVLMSGGGQIDDYWGGTFGQPFALYKWASLARWAGKPVGFLSVGVCALKTAGSQFFALRALRLANYRSYRDAGSKEMLRNYPFTKRDQVFPDLAFSHPRAGTDTGRRAANPGSRMTIGLSPIAFLSSHGWPERDQAAYQRYVHILADFATKLLDEGHSVVLFTSASQDRFAVADLRALLHRHSHSSEWRDRFKEVKQTNLDDQLQVIGNLDLVVASRLHGLILSNLLGKPTLAISYDRKVRVHMESIGLLRYCMDFRDFTFDQLAVAFSALAAEMPDVSTSIRSKISVFAAKLGHQFDAVAETLSGKVAPHEGR